MLESRVERALVDGVRKAGGWALKLTSPGNAGVPDRLVLVPGGQIIFVELKTDTGSLSPLQIQTHIRLQKLGMDVRTLYGMDQVRMFVEEVMSDAFQALSVSGSGRTVDSGA